VPQPNTCRRLRTQYGPCGTPKWRRPGGSDTPRIGGAAPGAGKVRSGPAPSGSASAQANARQLRSLCDQATGRVPDEARLVDPLPFDQVRALPDTNRARRREGPHECCDAQSSDPTREFDFEGAGG
jgi:hypothetical protein